MSLRIIKEGMLDTVQDLGRKGKQHLGINPGGAMDLFSAQLANALLGKELHAPVLELHFPASQILIEKPTIISICGADFQPTINQKAVPLHHPIFVNENSLLQFTSLKWGARTYIAVLNELELEAWESSYSTNLAAGMGGYGGRALKRYDVINFRNAYRVPEKFKEEEFMVLPWKSHEAVEYRNTLECLIGADWHALQKQDKDTFLQHWFQISPESNRMGFRMKGPDMHWQGEATLLSSGVNFGTIQLLPDGKLIILMADHQTTGGYPRIAHIISAHLPLLAQKKPGDAVRFTMVDLKTAEEKLVKQQKYLEEIGIACKFRIENFADD